MNAYQEIQDALTKSLLGLSLGLDITQENVDFDPLKITGDQYLDPSFLTNEKTSLDKTLFDEGTGVYQIKVYTKSGIGTKESTELTDTLINYYKHNLNLIEGDQCVVIINSGKNQGRNENGWWVIDVSVSFKSDIAR